MDREWWLLRVRVNFLLGRVESWQLALTLARQPN